MKERRLFVRAAVITARVFYIILMIAPIPLQAIGYVYLPDATWNVCDVNRTLANLSQSPSNSTACISEEITTTYNASKEIYLEALELSGVVLTETIATCCISSISAGGCGPVILCIVIMIMLYMTSGFAALYGFIAMSQTEIAVVVEGIGYKCCLASCALFMVAFCLSVLYVACIILTPRKTYKLKKASRGADSPPTAIQMTDQSRVMEIPTINTTGVILVSFKPSG
ncbi:uncharacterized protein LOC117324147 [Pecten maximus]|uniref:uncharacterized protein LOC117324147 n=1 Tax=Pecten maximus TaxID=6579 RepID=UPI001458F9E1|nr:uncharacterized protein LOC117324147 [Pecten maximus]